MRTDTCLELPARTAEAHAIFTVADVAGVGIECQSGCVWLTLDDDPRDLVLEAGERSWATMHRRVLVSALEPSSIAVSGSRCRRPCRSGAAAPGVVPRRLLPHGLSPA